MHDQSEKVGGVSGPSVEPSESVSQDTRYHTIAPEPIVAPAASSELETASNVTVPAKKKAGRPKKQEIEAKKKGNFPTRGRPPGDAAAVAEFKARLLNSPKSRKVLDSILNAALDDNHKNQAAAWKLCMERLLPVGMFEKGSGGKAAVTINITGLGGDVSVSSNEQEEGIIDGDYEVDFGEDQND